MQKTKILLIIAIFLSVNLFAGGGLLKVKVLSNEYNLEYGMDVRDGAGTDFINFPKQDYSELILELDSLHLATKSIEYLKDIAFLHTGNRNFEQALAVYLKIEAVEPGQYSTASSLSYLYEYMGDEKKALEWFNKANLIRPSGSDKSTYIRAKILEAKQKEDDFLKMQQGSFFTGLNFGNEAQPKAPKTTTNLYDLERALREQINIRLPFSQGPNPILALLYFELANTMAITKNAEVDEIIQNYNQNKDAIRMRCNDPGYLFDRYNEPSHYAEILLYEQSASQGLRNTLLLERMQLIQKSNDKKSAALAKHIKRIEHAHSNAQTNNKWLLYSFAIVIILTLAVFIFFRIRKI